MTADEMRIREFAYQIWESEGRPAGKHDRHWEMARKLVEAENQEAARPAIRNRKVTRPTEANLTPETDTPAADAAAAQKPRGSAAKTSKEPKEPKAPKAPRATKTPKTPKSK